MGVLGCYLRLNCRTFVAKRVLRTFDGLSRTRCILRGLMNDRLGIARKTAIGISYPGYALYCVWPIRVCCWHGPKLFGQPGTPAPADKQSVSFSISPFECVNDVNQVRDPRA